MTDNEKPSEGPFYLVLVYGWSEHDYEHHINLTKQELNDFIKDKTVSEIARYHIYKSEQPLVAVEPAIKFE